MIGTTRHPDAVSFIAPKLECADPNLQHAAVAALKDLKVSDYNASLVAWDSGAVPAATLSVETISFLGINTYLNQRMGQLKRPLSAPVARPVLGDIA